MTFRFDFSLSFGTVQGGEGHDMDPTNWAKKQADRVREELKRKEAKDSKMVTEQRLKEAHAPGLWSELCEQLKQRVEAFNRESSGITLAWESIKSNGIVVSIRDTPLSLRGKFDPDRLDIDFMFPNGSRSYIPKVVDGTVLLCEQDGITRGAEAIAEHVLDRFLEFIPN